MDLSPLQIIGGLLGGTGASSAFTWLTQRGKQKLDLDAAVDRAMSSALEGVSKQLERADNRLKIMEGHHEKCTEDLAEVRRDLEESKREREELKRQINSLMAGPPATYNIKSMKRVGP